MNLPDFKLPDIKIPDIKIPQIKLPDIDLSNFTLPELKIGKFTAKIPIIQGGMGVGISRANLASAVARAGAVGVIASVGLGLLSPYYKGPSDFFHANISALKDEIRATALKANNGIFGVNCMVALTDYEELVRTSVECGAKTIISGAGIPLKLPEYTKDFPDVALVPIVSSAKGLGTIIKKWTRSYGIIPDAVILESPNHAGGHLGASRDKLGLACFEADQMLEETIDYLKKEAQMDIPVIVAGGIWDDNDIKRVISKGASGVQMATRFVCTHECDAPMSFKQKYLDAKGPEDITIIDSPVGLPGRALKNNIFLPDEDGTYSKVNLKCVCKCLKKCSFLTRKAGFCIARALELSAKGDVNGGLVFVGSNGYKCNEIISVQELIEKLTASFVRV
jgi:nitronate monooxygenase